MTKAVKIALAFCPNKSLTIKDWSATLGQYSRRQKYWAHHPKIRLGKFLETMAKKSYPKIFKNEEIARLSKNLATIRRDAA